MMRNGTRGLPCTVLTHHLFFLAAATPLTPEAVTEAVKEADLDQLAWCLYGTSRVDDIKSHYPPEDHRRVLVDWWFSTDPAPSWRRLIYIHLKDSELQLQMPHKRGLCHQRLSIWDVWQFPF